MIVEQEYYEQAEQMVVGMMLLYPEIIKRVKLSLLDFEDESNRNLYESIKIVDKSNDPVTHASIYKLAGGFEKFGGFENFKNITNIASGHSGEAIDFFQNVVKERSAKKKVLEVAKSMTNEHDKVQDLGQFLQKSLKKISNINKDIVRDDNFFDFGKKAIDAYKYIEGNKERDNVVKTGIANIDNMIGGMQPGLLHILAGRPGMGKSAFLLNVAINAAVTGKRVLFFSLEDTGDITTARLISRYSFVPLEEIIHGKKLDNDQWSKITDAVNKISTIGLQGCDKPGMTSDDLRMLALVKSEEIKCNLIIIDHLHEFADRAENETVKITTATQNIRDLAKELNIPILMACQLSRSVEARQNKRPMMSDLRQSGAIEAIARMIWFLYRPAYYMSGSDSEKRKDLELIIAKNSHGKTGTARLFAELSHMFIRSWEKDEDGQWPGEDDSFSSSVTTKSKGFLYDNDEDTRY